MPDCSTTTLSPFTRCLMAAWGITVLGGVLAVTAYSNSPGAQQDTGDEWPADSTISLHSDLPTILLFVHPKCPCSLATVRELQRSLGNDSDAMSIQIGLYGPEDRDDSWTDTRLKKLAEQAFADSTFVDRNGTEAKRFGAITSGHVLAFSPTGRCLFRGGVTSARGHEGDNLGLEALRQIVAGTPNSCTTTPVFGCPIAATNE
ncbi:MAG: hypothetical protein ABJZ55_14620 [Fuerstiella sp.]